MSRKSKKACLVACSFALLITSCSSDPEPVETRNVSVDTLTSGDCFTQLNETSSVEADEEVELGPCDQEHTSQVFATYEGTEYPDLEATCLIGFEENLDDADTPSLDTGSVVLENTVLCFTYNTDGSPLNSDLIGS